jgi:hypothetical protein
MSVQRIFIRRDGVTVEITREEWNELYPGRLVCPDPLRRMLGFPEPVVVETEDDGHLDKGTT